MNYLAPKERDVAMVFQNYALYPHITVGENLEFGLKLRNVPTAERTKFIAEAGHVVGFDGLLTRR